MARLGGAPAVEGEVDGDGLCRCPLISIGRSTAPSAACSRRSRGMTSAFGCWRESKGDGARCSRPHVRRFEPANPGIAFSLRRMILVLGTTAAAVLIAMIVWPARKPASIAPAVASVPFAYVVPSPIVPTVRPLGPSELQPMARSEPRRPATEAAIPNDGAVSIEVAILNPLAPIAVASVRTEQIAPARIELRPLAPLTDIGVALIQPPDRRH